jgi:diguanylate cyclase (GGDEF)-like protein
MTADSPEISILFVEDAPEQAELAMHQLRRAGMRCVSQCVATESELRACLAAGLPDIIISDFSIPGFGGMEALRIATEIAPEIPFVFLSGTIGEERAIEALRRGAVDYVLKSNLARLAPAIVRALKDAALRMEAQRQQSQITRLTRVLRMLSGINGLALRITDRSELLSEASRLAVQVGGYSSAVALLKKGVTGEVRPVAWAGNDAVATDALRCMLEESATRATSVVGRVLHSGTIFVANDTIDLKATAQFSKSLLAAGFRCLVALPLSVDGTPVGVLVLTAHEVGTVGEEELGMLREVGTNLSFALQYHHKESTVRLLANFDPRTGLAKRPLFCERLGKLIADKRDRRGRLGIVVFDLERLSVINDSFGRDTGDRLLQQVTGRMRQRVPNTEQLAHFNGGTFAILQQVPTQDREQALKALAECAASLFHEAFVIEGRELPVTIRSGFVLHPEDGKDAEELVQHAEAALWTARRLPQKQSRFDAEKHGEAVARLALEHKLRLALEREQFELHYQPKVDIRTRRIAGVEALIRWRHPESGLVSPAAFLPLLESAGLIVEVGDWVFRARSERLPALGTRGIGGASRGEHLPSPAQPRWFRRGLSRRDPSLVEPGAGARHRDHGRGAG